MLLVLASAHAAGAVAEPDVELVLERLDRLEQRQAELEAAVAARDERIRELEARLAEPADAAPAPAPATSPTPSDDTVAAAPAMEPEAQVRKTPACSSTRNTVFSSPAAPGSRSPARPHGDVNFSAWAYIRYLNQQGLDQTYTDSFGRTNTLDLRNDVQVNKVNIYFKGWVFDPRFHYNLWTWTTNTSQGEPAQIVLAGDLGYKFSEKFDLRLGVLPLPGTRTLRGQHPYWNKVDHRTIGNEFFRPSFTTGIIANGKLAEGLFYRAAIANNMSALGVSAAQLDDEFNTVSAALWWMPTTGEYRHRHWLW